MAHHHQCATGYFAHASCDCGLATEEPAEPLKPGHAHFSYSLEASTGYEQSGTYHNITPERFGEVIGVLEGKGAALNGGPLLEAARAVVAQFDNHEALRGPMSETFVNPFNKTRQPNGVTIRVELLRALSAALKGLA